MIEVDQRPEDLLDRLVGDTATDDDVRAVRNALAPSLEDKMRNERAVSAAMGRLAGGSRRRAPRVVWMVAAAAVLVAGVAGARYLGQLRTTHATSNAPAPAPAKPAAESPNTAPPETPTTTDGVSATPDKAKARALPSPEPRETASQLFAEANELRRTGKDSQAMAAYRKVERSFPGSPEAEQSYATLGSLMMEHGSPQEALGQFDHYIERGGPLLVDVLAGKAGALQRLGRASEERRAWQTLLERFPKSVHATRAKTRLAELH